MPIYSYRCEACEHAQDVLQKISDPPLVVCPSCGESAYRKQVTAAGFQLKGSGWYVTDFRNKPAVKAGTKSKDEKETTASNGASNGDKAASGSDSGANEKAPSPATSDAASTSTSGDKGASKSPPSSAPSTTASN